jgi:Holliday junction resolvase
MTSPSKNKGNSFEREIAQFLTGLYGETFIRAPGSGAYVGGSNSRRKEVLHEGQIRSFKGDIVPGQSFPRLNAECKSYADLPFHQLFSGNVKQLDSWIVQCLDASDAGDANIIFMKFNRKGRYILFQIATTDTTSRDTSQDIKDTTSTLSFTNHFIYQSPGKGTWVLMSQDKFFELNAAQFKNLCA